MALRRGIVSKLLNAAVATLCVAALIIGLGAVLLKSPVAGAVPGLRGAQPLVVLSGSMEPQIKVGSLLFIRPVEPADIEVGDVITFATPQYGEGTRPLTTHRVGGVSGEGAERTMQTKGDGNKSQDAWEVHPDDVLGEAVLSIPYLGYVSSFARSRTGFMLLVVLPAVVLVGAELRSLFRDVRRGRERPDEPDRALEETA